MASLTDTQLAALESLRGRLADVALHDSVLRSFLEYRHWRVDEACTTLQEHLKWRAQNLPVPRGDVAEVLEAGRVSLLGSGADGRPVFMLSLPKLLKVNFSRKEEVKRHVRATVYCAEEMIAGMPPGVYQWVAIINCAGIILPPTKYLQEFAKVFTKNYPERVHKTIMYPVPKAIVKLVKSFMWFVPDNTREKFCFVDTLDKLCQETGLSLESLPKELINAQAVSGDAVVPEGTTVLDVGAGKSKTHRHTLAAGESVEWEFHTEGHSVLFRLWFRASDGDGEVEELVRPARLEGKNGVYTAGRAGALEFLLDNSFSMMTGKRCLVTVREAVADPTDETESDATPA